MAIGLFFVATFVLMKALKNIEYLTAVKTGRGGGDIVLVVIVIRLFVSMLQTYLCDSRMP